MNESAEKSIKLGGYTIRIRVRVQKKRRRVKGRARGFYEGKYVYARVTGPDGVQRDHYLGTDTKSAGAPGRPAKGGGRTGALQLEELGIAVDVEVGGRNDGYKPSIMPWSRRPRGRR